VTARISESGIQERLKMGGQLTRSQKVRLSVALEGLPQEIAYLRKAIMAIAEQDRGLFGSGEADVTPLLEVLRQRGEPETLASVAAGDADILHGWLESLADHDAAWAGPIASAEGFLRGCAFAEPAELEPRPTAPLALGLQRVTIEIPPDMKVAKRYAGGLELRNREVRIIIGQVTADKHQYKLQVLRSRPMASMQDAPHLREEIDFSFHIAGVSGAKVVCRHIESGLVVMADYTLTLLDVGLEVGVFSRSKLGVDLSKYEHLLGTIRLK
jgi:hypothetical protein